MNPPGSPSPAAELRKCLLELKRIDWVEMIIFLQDTLDVLLLLLIKAPDSNNLDYAVFEAFVDVVYNAGKQHKGEPVLKAYIDHNFSAAMVYSKLIVLLKDYMDKSSRYSQSMSLRLSNYRGSGVSSETFVTSQSNQSLEKVEDCELSEYEGSTASAQSILNKAMKSLPYIIKFIIKSRQLYAK